MGTGIDFRSAAALLGALLLTLIQGGCKRKESYPEGPMPVSPGMPGGPAAPPGAPPAMPPSSPLPPAGPSPVEIAALEQAAAREPRSAQAWIRLGDAYFDTHQPQKAVDAYAKALEIDPRNPNVLTDQGVMYRDLGQYQKALDNFRKASEIDPSHIQSVFNMGVVYSTNLGQPEKAAQAWNRVIEMAPASPQAAQARQLVESLKAQRAR